MWQVPQLLCYMDPILASQHLSHNWFFMAANPDHCLDPRHVYPPLTSYDCWSVKLPLSFANRHSWLLSDIYMFQNGASAWIKIHLYKIYRECLLMQVCAAGYALTPVTPLKLQLLRWMVTGLTAITLSMHDFSLFSNMYIWIYMVCLIHSVVSPEFSFQWSPCPSTHTTNSLQWGRVAVRRELTFISII
jgi:hypothetical protein